jgi:glyoxylase-like metal-dependent hydrolase (beta-lactamase superfamily II)
MNAQPAFFPGERTLWLPAHNALVAGDCLPGGGAIPDAWLESEWAKATREEYNLKLCPLLDLPIELLLPTHGDPVVEDAHARLAKALS